MWRPRGKDNPLTRDDVQTMMAALCDLRRDVTEILRILKEDDDGEAEEADD